MIRCNDLDFKWYETPRREAFGRGGAMAQQVLGGSWPATLVLCESLGGRARLAKVSMAARRRERPDPSNARARWRMSPEDADGAYVKPNLDEVARSLPAPCDTPVGENGEDE